MKHQANFDSIEAQPGKVPFQNFTSLVTSFSALKLIGLFISIPIKNKYAIYAYTHGPVTGSGFLETNTVV